VTYAVEEIPPGLKHRLESAGMAVEHAADVEGTVALAKSIRATHAVLDGYRLDPSHQEALADAHVATLVIDDNAEVGRYPAPLVLNVNPFASESMYRHRSPHTRLLLGLRYALLRKEFREPEPRRETPQHAQRVLVTMGGADPTGLTLRALQALRELDGLETKAVVGSANPRFLEIAAVATDHIRVLEPQTSMAALMREADMAVVTASGTCWELARLGVPVLAAITAENQERVGEQIHSLGLGRCLGQERTLDAEALRRAIDGFAGDFAARASASMRGPELVDGRGAERVCDALREVAA
jgi:spore coat polysaccharide biosynthesis predicted glycosyltransferase SpsG